MAAKLNKSLVGALTLTGMLLMGGVGFLLIRNMPGADPAKFEADAKKHEEKGDWLAAAQSYQRAFTFDKRSTNQRKAEWLAKQAKCFFELGDFGALRAITNKALVLNPALVSAADLVTRAEYEIARTIPGAGTGEWKVVLDNAKRLIELDPQSSIGQEAAGSAWLKLSAEDRSNKELGERALLKALEIDPVNVNAATALADFLHFEKRSAEAERLIDQTIEKAESSQAKEAAAKLRVYRGIRMMADRRMEEAEREFSAAEQASPGLVDSHMAQARFWLTKGSEGYANALTKLEAAMKANPGSPEPYVVMAAVFQEQNKPKEELETLERGLENVKKGKGFRFITANYLRIVMMKQAELNALRAGEIDPSKRDEALANAAKWVTRAEEEIGPDWVDVRVMRAFLKRAKNEFVDATRELEQVDKALGGQRSIEVKWMLSDLYLLQGQYGAAVDALKELLTVNPLATAAYLRLATALVRSNDYEQALRVLTVENLPEVARELQTNPQAAVLRAECYRALGQTEKIEAERKIVSKAGTPEDRIRSAQMLAVQGRGEEAVAMLRDVTRDAPKLAAGHAMLAQQLLAMKDESGARAAVEAGLAANPEDRVLQQLRIGLQTDLSPDERRAKIMEFIAGEKNEFLRALLKYNFHYSRDEFKEAKLALDEAERIDPKSPAVLEQLFNYAIREKDWATAEKYAARDAELNSDGTKGRLLRGRLAIAKQDYAQAITTLNEGLAEYPSIAEGWVQLATAYYLNKQESESRNAAERALKLNSSNPQANKILGVLNLRAGRKADAKKNLEIAARQMPTDALVREQLQRLREEEDPASGVASREELRQRQPENVENLVLLARLYAKLKQVEKADEVIKAAIALGPKETSTLHELAVIYGRDLERPSEGEAVLRTAMQKASGDADKAKYAMLLGQYYQLLDSFDNAERHYLLAAKLNPVAGTVMTVGEFYAQTNRPAEALDWFGKARTLVKPGDREMKMIRERIVQMMIINRDKENVEKEIDSYIAAYPTDEQGRLFRGFHYLQMGDLSRAETAFKQLLELQPTNAMALWQLGQIYLLRNRWQLAIEELKKSKAFRPDGFNYDHRVALARALIGSGRFDDGAAELQSILKDAPEKSEIVLLMIEQYLNTTPPRFTEADNLAYTYMRRYPDDPRWPTALGRIGVQSGNLPKAVEGYSQAVRASKFSTGSVISLIAAFEASQQYDEIIDFVTKRLPPARRARLPMAESALAKAYAAKGRMEEATESFKLALARARDDYESYRYVARAMAEGLGLERALEQARLQAESSKESTEPLKIYMQLLYLNRKFDEALRVCDQIINAAERDDDLTFGLAAQGIVLSTLKRPKEAVEKYETVLKLDPNYALVLNNIAYVLCDELKKPQEALPYAERAETIAPKDPDTLDTLGWTLAEVGRLPDAEGTLLRALDLNPDNLPAMYHLGVVYKRMGNKEDARYRLEAAVRRSAELKETDFGPLAEAELKGLSQ